MNNFIKNIILLVVVLILSYFTAPYFGSVYDKFAPQYDNSLLSLSQEGILVLVGLPFAYVFFVIFLFKIFGSGSKNKWVMWLLAPPTLLWIFVDFGHIYLPIILGLATFVLAYLLNPLISKLHHPNPPMMVK